MELGNNIEAKYIRRISFPLFDQFGTTNNGTKYFLPERPDIDNKTVVGIEAHLNGSIGRQGDLNKTERGLNANVAISKLIYLSFYNENFEELFTNVPLQTLFGRETNTGISPKQKIKPYYGKIKTKNCFAYVPANLPLVITGDFYITLTFYLR